MNRPFFGWWIVAAAFLTFGIAVGIPYSGMPFLYVVGYIFSGPIAHQVIISQWFKKRRGVAMAVCYLGVGIFGALSAKAVAKPLTEAFGFRGALQIIAGMMLLTWPIALWIMKDKPSEIGQ